MSRAPRRDRRTAVRPARTADTAPGLAARRGAVALLAEVLGRGRIPDESRLPEDAASRAEAQRLAETVFRRLGEIDRILAERVPKAPRQPALNILRVMVAELVFLETAPHAAVDLAVRLAKHGPAGRLSGLVNATGRRLVAEPPARHPDPAWAAMPDWLWQRLSADWGEARAEAIAAAHLTHPPLDITLAPTADRHAIAAALGAEPLPSGGLRRHKPGQVSALPGFAEGAWWVQDAAASLPAQLIAPAPGMRVLDLCAAPGGKTMQLAAAGAHVTALDISAQRLGRLEENLARTGLKAEIVEADALDWTPGAPFDAVLLDAPCSATGTVRRHPDLQHRIDPAGIGALVRLQAQLLARAWDWVRPGGCLVYAVCSMLREEGEERAAAVAEETGCQPASLPTSLAEFAADGGGLRTLPDLWPEIGGLDGFYAARFDKP